MGKISFAFNLECSFDLKLGRTFVSIENSSLMVFELVRPNERRELGVTEIREFLENENLTAHFF